MILCDAHTHGGCNDTTLRIVQADIQDESMMPGSFSVGIHPKDAELKNLGSFTPFFGHPGLRAIGECGLDRTVREIPLEHQKKVFLQHAELAEKLRKPLILHCVRCSAEIIALKKQVRPTIPWIYHGFRGNERKAMELVNAGFFLSFGAGLLRDAGNVEPFFSELPSDRILTETDAEPPELLPQIIATAAQMSDMDMLSFSRLILSNFKSVFKYDA